MSVATAAVGTRPGLYYWITGVAPVCPSFRLNFHSFYKYAYIMLLIDTSIHSSRFP
ncbi:hypothetical protein BDV26DRAFT_264905 [Aspergillus bertholletiae]|uniref:Uncharacterized protein n=1 Tax=Aspergillus bertholletiae TaxID=1226010 RepID=A0A5N7B4D0_9EURO|nr:hypothetical protein BDV26DRAFT_264905 [Aspergillus bertholletiae]